MSDLNSNKHKKRKKVKLNTPINELFIKWLEEWYVEAATKGSKIQYAFGKALVSLKRYPLPLQCGKEAMILEHFGPGICIKLDRRLAEYKKENPNEFPAVTEDDVIIEDEYYPAKKTKTNKSPAKSEPSTSKVQSPLKTSYMPIKNSPAYAIFVAMHENGLESSISNTQLRIVVKRLINKTYPDSCIDNLIKRNLITENFNSDMFTLTKDGIKVAELVYAKYILSNQNMIKAHVVKGKEITSYTSRINDFDIIPLGSSAKTDYECEVINLDNDVIEIDSDYKSESSNKVSNILKSDSQSSSNDKYSSSSSKQSNTLSSNSQSKFNSQTSTSSYATSSQSNSQTQSNSQSSDETICMLPNTFKIVLVVDNHETGVRYTQQTETEDELKKLKIDYVVKGLKIGDFTWIAKDEYNNELVLPYIIERKRMDDFAQSIKDSRFQEQKFRLKKCGIKNLIYMVENYGSNMFLGLPLTSVLQAATNTEIIDKFTVKFTDSHQDSMVYLQHMTMFISNLYSNKTLMSTTNKDELSGDSKDDIITLMKYSYLNKISSKTRNYKVKEMFIKQLIQLSGLSLAKALVIVEKYPTPLELINAFHKKGPNLIADLKYTELGSRIGNAISNTLYQFYTRQNFT